MAWKSWRLSTVSLTPCSCGGKFYLPSRWFIAKFRLSMLFFIVAFSYEWCKPGDAVSRATVGTVLLVVCGLIVWCIYVASDKRAPWWWKSDKPQDGGKTSKPHKRKHSWRKVLTTRLCGWFTTTKNRVSVVSVRHSRNGPPPVARGAIRTPVPLINFRRATVSRQNPPKITVTTRPESGEVNAPRTPSDAGVGYR